MALPYVITYPPSFDVPDEQWQPVTLLFSYLENSLVDMTIALDCYERARKHLFSNDDRNLAKSMAEARAQGQRQSDFEKEVAAKHGLPNREEMHGLERNERRNAELALEIAVAHERAALGHIPRDFIHRAPQTHALSFLGAADRFRKCLKALATRRNEVRPVWEAFVEEFRGLKGVRDSAQHIDDRAQWLGRDNRGQKTPLDIAVLQLENLEGDALTSVDERGELASFIVSLEVLHRFGEVLQTAIDAMPARGGRPTIRPVFGPFPAS